MEKITAVLINYNDEKYIKPCIDSLLAQTYSNLDIIVVDNNSADNSMKIVESDYVPHGRVKTVYNNCNKGFGDACNVGADYAFSNGAEFVLFINTDTESQPNLVEELVKYSDSGEAMTTAKTYRDKECKELWYSGGFIDFENACCNQTFFSEDETQPKIVDFASGCCMFISKNIWNKAGKFDEDYFLYYEDTDYCVKLKENDISIIYVPTTYLWHKVGGSVGGEMSPVSQYYGVRNRLLFAKKHKALMKIELLDILSSIVKDPSFCDGRYKEYIEQAIYDFLREITGKEESLLHNDYVFVFGFYQMEQANGIRWRWVSQKEAVIEFTNHSGDDRIVEFSADLISAFEGQTVEIYWNDEHRENLSLPAYGIYSQCLVPAGGVAMLKLVADLEPNSMMELGMDARPIFFGVQNYSAKQLPYYGVVAKSGFYRVEEANGNHWQWVNQKEAVMEIKNNSGNECLMKVHFIINPLLENQEGKVKVFCGQDLLLEVPVAGSDNNISVPMPANAKKNLVFKYDGQFITGHNGDGRTLGYMVKNMEARNGSEF